MTDTRPLRTRRREAKLTQRKLAELAGLSRRTILRVEHGLRIRPAPATLEAIERVLAERARPAGVS